MSDPPSAQQRRVPNALAICQKCHGLCIAHLNNWIGSKTGESTWHNDDVLLTRSISTMLMEIKDTDYTKWAFYENYSKLSSNLEQLNLQPLCNQCAPSIIDDLHNLKCFYQQEVDSINSKKARVQGCIERMKQEIESMQHEIDILNEVNTRRPSPSLIARDSSPKPISPKKSDPPSSYRVPSGGFSSLVLTSSYHISTSTHYGTINGIRLGFGVGPDKVGFEEVEIGFTFLSQLIKQMGRFVGIPTPELDVYGSVNDQKGLVSFKFTEFKHRADFEQLNRILYIFYFVSSKIFESPQIADSVFLPPNPIDMKERKISVRKFEYSKSDPTSWVIALKWLLCNYQSIQSRALFKAVGSMRISQ